MTAHSLFKKTVVLLILVVAMLVLVIPAGAETVPGTGAGAGVEAEMELQAEAGEEEVAKYTGDTVRGMPVISQLWLNLYAPGSYAEPGTYPGVNVQTEEGYLYIPYSLLGN